jgi:hypothetical protein
MLLRHRAAALLGSLCALGAGAALAADLVPVKIGVLNDMLGRLLRLHRRGLGGRRPDGGRGFQAGGARA